MSEGSNAEKIAAIDYDLSELETHIRRCRNALEKLKRAGEQARLPQTLDDPEEFEIAVNMIDDFYDEIRCFCHCLEVESLPG